MSNSELQSYLTDVGRLPVLSKEAQLRHCQRIFATAPRRVFAAPASAP
jgi:hypothetical protein